MDGPCLKMFLYFFSKRNVKVYLHKTDQFLNLNGRMGYKIHINESIQNQVNIQNIRYTMILSFINKVNCFQR